MSWTAQKIKTAFSGKLMVKSFMAEEICKIMLFLPPEIIEHITKTTWFISSPEDAWAFTFRASDISESHLIILSEELFRQPKIDIYYTILHEIGHVILSHENSLKRKQTKEEIKKQEKEAEEFAKKYLNYDSWE